MVRVPIAVTTDYFSIRKQDQKQMMNMKDTLNPQTLKLAAMTLNQANTFDKLTNEDIVSELEKFSEANPDHREIIEVQFVSSRLAEILELIESKLNRPTADMLKLLAGQAEAMNFYVAYLVARIAYTQRYGGSEKKVVLA